mmetsp:Transcript_49431/g.96647  ORF Transcript_49431/g.96647 Transcript_49431/m.96647 type:complete len:238 (-) Transcript_49431:615-1328(-)
MAATSLMKPWRSPRRNSSIAAAMGTVWPSCVGRPPQHDTRALLAGTVARPAEKNRSAARERTRTAPSTENGSTWDAGPAVTTAATEASSSPERTSGWVLSPTPSSSKASMAAQTAEMPPLTRRPAADAIHGPASAIALRRDVRDERARIVRSGGNAFTSMRCRRGGGNAGPPQGINSSQWETTDFGYAASRDLSNFSTSHRVLSLSTLLSVCGWRSRHTCRRIVGKLMSSSRLPSFP